MTNPEYKIVTGTPADCEDKLNEWKMTHDLTILKMCNSAHGLTILLLKTIPQAEARKIA